MIWKYQPQKRCFPRALARFSPVHIAIAEAACRRPQSFLRKSNGDGLSHGPDEDNVICRDRVNRSDSIRYFVALLYDHVSEPQYLPPSEHRLTPAQPWILYEFWGVVTHLGLRPPPFPPELPKFSEVGARTSRVWLEPAVR